jgi:hypothetical protein
VDARITEIVKCENAWKTYWDTTEICQVKVSFTIKNAESNDQPLTIVKAAGTTPSRINILVDEEDPTKIEQQDIYSSIYDWFTIGGSAILILVSVYWLLRSFFKD